jgi:hypothetical protein
MYNELIVIYITNAVSYILQSKVLRLQQKPNPSDVKCLQRGRRLITRFLKFVVTNNFAKPVRD